MRTSRKFLAAARTIDGPPMSISSTRLVNGVAGFAAAVANGYKLTTTTSTRPTPWALSAARSSGRSRRARMPPWSFGCRVLTRPSSISGKPVTSETLVTGSPASARAFAVPPVETSSKPRDTRPRPRSSIPRLSETLSNALGIGGEVQYYLLDAGRAWRRKGKAAQAAAFFFASATVAGAGSTTRRKYSVDVRKKNDAHHRKSQVVQQRQGLRIHRA